MPSKKGIGLDDQECFFPALPMFGQEEPKYTIGPPELRAPLLPLQNGELLECQIFQREVGT